MLFYRYVRNESKCRNCGFCTEVVFCPGEGKVHVAGSENCIGCSVCYEACVYEAVERIIDTKPRRKVKIKVNGEEHSIPDRITVKKALEIIGYTCSPLPGKADLYVPCGLGGCYACASLIDREPKPICATSVKDGMEIQLKPSKPITSLRRVSGYQPHPVGGVGTPWRVKRAGYYIEVACFAHGCNFRCRQCLPSFEKVLVRINGHPQLMSIGELFEKEFNSESDYYKPINRIEVISFNPKTFKVDWAPVSALIKRRGNCKVLRIKVRTGREFHVTHDHPVFILNKDGLVTKRAHELTIGDHVLVAKRLPTSDVQNLHHRSEIDLIDVFSATEFKDLIWVSGIRGLVLKKAKLLTKREVGACKWRNTLCITELGRRLVKNNGAGWRWYKKNRMPLIAYLKLEDDKSFRRYLRISVRGAKSGWIPAIIPINKDLLRFIGYYLAEGNADQASIRLSFNINERDLIDEVKAIIRRLFDLPVTERVQRWKGKESCIVLTIHGKILSLFIEAILNMGRNSYDKHIPDFVYELPQLLIHELIDAYFLGDGSIHPAKRGSRSLYVHVWTISRELVHGLDILLLMSGIASRIAKSQNGYMIFIQGGKNMERFLAFASIARRRGLTHNPANIRLSLSESLPDFLSDPLRRTLLRGDVYPAEITSIEEMPYNGDFFDFEIQSPFMPYANFMHGLSVFTHNCQNYSITYDNSEPPSTPREAASILTAYRLRYKVDRIAISGGEPTLNRPWLIGFFKELRRLNPDARLHLDTNASILMPDYVDELIKAGVTDIGPDLKGIHLETFMKITNVLDKELAKTYLENAWNITKYIVDTYYPEKVFIGVGIPYNRFFMSFDELREIGDALFKIHPELQVTVLDYFPTFRRYQEIRRPSVEEMKRAREILLESGLKIVLAQTVLGHIGP
jgi:intein/homing endonuclease/ferredoxin